MMNAKEKINQFVDVRTASDTGFSFVTEKLDISTPLGVKELKGQLPFLPGDEEALKEELNRLENILGLVEDHAKTLARIKETFHCLKDITGSIERSRGEVLSQIEIFEIKSFIIYVNALRGILVSYDGEIPEEFIPEETKVLMDLLDPRGDKTNSFYIYDEYSKKLAELRGEKKKLEAEIRKVQKILKDKIQSEHGIILTPKFDIVIPKSSDQVEAADNCSELNRIGEDYSSVTFGLAMPQEVESLVEAKEALALKIEDEEYVVRKELSRKIGERSDALLLNAHRVGRLDYVIAKAELAVKYSLVKPEISPDHALSFKGGRHIQVEEILKSKGRSYFPIDLNLKPGVTCITGANMGGKTVSLKLTGLMALMAQFGYYLPCEKATIGLSSSVRILVGDNQSLEKGLSGFGSEMEELKEMMAGADDRALLLIDEIAGGTNPSEGQALIASIGEYLASKPYISMLTTHYDMFTIADEVEMLQVRGLGDVDYDKLDMELKQAGTDDRIEVIGKYMDYSLVPLNKGGDIPRDAINIADMLGLPREIINGARKHLSKE